MPSLPVDDFLAFASRLEGEQLTTSIRSAAFTISVSGDSIQVTPESSGKPRMVTRSVIERFLEEFGRSGSWQKSHYQDITFDASYLLAVLSRYYQEYATVGGRVAGPAGAPRDEAADCPFCRPGLPRILHLSPHAVALRDAYPLTEGHTLVVPRQHVASLFDLPAEAQADLWRLVARVRADLAPSADGFTIGINDGEAAGQTVGHAHVHVIPRRTGDVEDPRGGVRWVIPARAAYWDE